MSEPRDWANMPADLLREIAGRLPELPDLFRFWCVCSPWYSAAKSITNFSPHLPWLLYNARRSGLSGLSNKRLLCLSENCLYKFPSIRQPVYDLTRTYPAMAGHIFVLDSLKCFLLLNPITGSSLQIPIYFPPVVTKACKVRLFGSLFVALCSNEKVYNEAGLNISRGIHLFLYEITEKSSKTIRISPSLDKDVDLCDFTRRNEKLFFLSHCAHAIWVYDICTLERVLEIPLLFLFTRGYLVESPSGDLLVVLRTDWKRFVVLRLVETENELKWMETNTIGNEVILVDEEQATCFAASDFKGLRPNCIYFVESYGVKTFDINRHQCDETPLFMCVSLTVWNTARWFIPSL